MFRLAGAPSRKCPNFLNSSNPIPMATKRLVQEAHAVISELFKGLNVWSDPEQSGNEYEGKVAVQLGKDR